MAWLVLSISFALSGPFGTYEHLQHPVRAVFWFVVVGGSIGLGVSLRVILQHVFRNLPFLAASLIAAVATGAIVAVVVAPAVGLLPGDPRLIVPGQIEIALVVAALGFGFALLRHLLSPGPRSAAVAERAVPRLLQRLPDSVRGDILHLCAGDHYVEVVTDQGRHRVLMRFSDAIEEVAPIDGLRVHRSHWVARHAIRGARRSGGRIVLHLSNGTEVPVSRAYEEAVSALKLL